MYLGDFQKIQKNSGDGGPLTHILDHLLMKFHRKVVFLIGIFGCNNGMDRWQTEYHEEDMRSYVVITLFNGVVQPL